MYNQKFLKTFLILLLNQMQNNKRAFFLLIVITESGISIVLFFIKCNKLSEGKKKKKSINFIRLFNHHLNLY